MGVDDGVDVGPAHQWIAVLVPRLTRGDGAIPVALLAADVALAAIVGDVAKLLHVDVQHGAGMIVRVTADGLDGGSVDM